MDKLATLFGAAKLIAHRFHHTVTGPSFLPDHAYLGQLYDAYDEAYDATVERTIGNGEAIDIQAVNTSSAALSAGVSAGPDAWAKTLLDFEALIRAEVDTLFPTVDCGTGNLLAQFADDSQARSYKLRQRSF
jgi:DNA-binding ferritin-like protein